MDLKQNKTTCKPFKAAFGLRNNHFQTLYSSLFRKQKKVDVQEEEFSLSDGDFVDCAWSNKKALKNGDPIVVLFHGLTGSLHSSYIQGMMHRLEREGYTSVLMHFRGCYYITNKLPRSYHSGDTSDAMEWISDVSKNYPSNPIYAVGYSLGGNMLLKLLGECGKTSLIKKAVSVSAPMDLEISSSTMNRGFSKLYQYHLMRDLKLTLLKKYKYHDMKSLIGIDEEGVKRLKTFLEFDDIYTAPIHGFDSANDYYKKASSKQYLKDIATDTLIIHSLDDPFMTAKVLPSKDEISSHVNLEVYPHGGHVGFISESFYNPKYWLEDRIMNYFM